MVSYRANIACDSFDYILLNLKVSNTQNAEPKHQAQRICLHSFSDLRWQKQRAIVISILLFIFR